MKRGGDHWGWPGTRIDRSSQVQCRLNANLDRPTFLGLIPRFPGWRVVRCDRSQQPRRGWAILARQYRYSRIHGRKMADAKWPDAVADELQPLPHTWLQRDRSLYLSVLSLFRFQHPPLLIPWPEISVSRRRRFFRNYVRLSLGHEAGIPLLLRPTIAERLRRAAGSHWPVEEVG